jgi:hypothetical protein
MENRETKDYSFLREPHEKLKRINAPCIISLACGYTALLEIQELQKLYTSYTYTGIEIAAEKVVYYENRIRVWK